jgi:circadian clock protein KaiB
VTVPRARNGIRKTNGAARLPKTPNVAGQTPRSVAAIANLRRICDEHLCGRYSVEVVDLLREPARARGDEIVVIPTLVRRLPPPVKRIIGDLSNPERVLVGLDVQPAAETA